MLILRKAGKQEEDSLPLISMGFIERLRQQIEAKTLAAKQRDRELLVAQQTEEAVRLQRDAQEREFHRKRKKQAELFGDESGVKVLTSKLAKLIEQNPDKLSPKGKMRLPVYESYRYGATVFNSPIEYVASRLLFRHQLIDTDSISEAVIWNDGESSVTGETGNDATLSQYIKYFIVEVNPDGDVIFNSAERNPIPVNLWRRDKDCLERALEKAFNNPAVYTYSTSIVNSRPFTGGNTG